MASVVDLFLFEYPIPTQLLILISGGDQCYTVTVFVESRIAASLNKFISTIVSKAHRPPNLKEVTSTLLSGLDDTGNLADITQEVDGFFASSVTK